MLRSLRLLTSFLLIFVVSLTFTIAQDPPEPVATEEAGTTETDSEAMDAGSELPDMVVVEYEALFPEGIEWDAEAGMFLVGSLNYGTIFRIDDEGTIEPFIEDDALASSVGIHIDTTNNRLLVPNTNRAGVEGIPAASLLAYDLETGERLFRADLEAVDTELGGFFANDVTADADGNAYVTNSFAPVIYRVDTEGNAEVFVQSDEFVGQGFNLNGIVAHPDGYLIVAKANEGKLFKVPLDAPDELTEVELETPVSGADGLVYDADMGMLYIVSGSQSSVWALTSEDDWASATLADTFETSQSGTTAALRDGAVYVVYARLSDMGAETPPTEFTIERAVFENLTMMDE